MKGIILAGGSGTRLYPATRVVSKQLLTGLRQAHDLLPAVDAHDGRHPRHPHHLHPPRPAPLRAPPGRRRAGWGSRISYAAQPRPEGLAQAFIIGADFVAGGPACLILGDNIFYGHGFVESLRTAAATNRGATIFGYYVSRPRALRRGGVRRRRAGPSPSRRSRREPRSHYAVPGLYFYDDRVVDVARRPHSPRPGASSRSPTSTAPTSSGASCTSRSSGRGIAWLDTGTHESLLQAANFIQTIEERQGLKIACLEEIAYRRGYITADELEAMAEP